ncbi:MAG TPA: hypothetical protein VHQ43_07800 [Solirubrobacterales bacterium]|jgi:hypothetical protein|nr:hypothetical protein [Solirubrobacterales bacterium]
MSGLRRTVSVNLAAMPLEGHWKQTNTPLRTLSGRERKAAIGMVAITLVTIVALLLATAGDSRPGPAPGCISAPIAGRTGAELINRCGAKAVALCRRASGLEEPWAEAVSDACRNAAIRF